MVRLAHSIVGTLYFLLFSVGAVAASISGQIRLVDGEGAVRSDTDAVIYFRPAAEVAIEVPEEPLIMATERKRFTPATLPIVVGSSVAFPNRDPILHNAFSVSRSNPFDTGIFGEGEGALHRFDKPGLVRVYCNVHQAMTAHILVLDTPYFTTLNDGAFELSDLPDGPGKLYIWHPRARGKSIDITLPVSEEIDETLKLTKRRVPNHKNKHGKSYRKERRRGRY